MMDAGELLLSASDAGHPLTVDGPVLVIPAELPAMLRRDAARLRYILVLLLSLPIARLCDDMTDDERDAFGERAAILESDAGYPRDVAERAAVWWTRTPRDERAAYAA